MGLRAGLTLAALAAASLHSVLYLSVLGTVGNPQNWPAAHSSVLVIHFSEPV